VNVAAGDPATVGGWFDSHCHLDHSDPGDVASVLERARAAGVVGAITVGCDAQSGRDAIDLAARHDMVWATVGLHPHEARHGVDTIIGLLDEPRVVAVGECGLDYHYDHSPRPAQREAFAAQIQLAHERQLPLVVHTREAWPDTFAILDAEGVPARTVLHCFTGGPDEARRCLDRGAWLSFSGIVTFKNAVEVREAAQICPDDRLLVETDSPFLAPVPFRGKRNEPAYVGHVGSAIAALRGATVEAVAALTRGNAQVAFALPLL
jgi:TatD DNase family protein